MARGAEAVTNDAPGASGETPGDAVTRVVIVSASVAAGHDGVAIELARRLRVLGCTVELLDFVDLVPGGWGRRLREAYRTQLNVAPRSWDWLLRVTQRFPVLAAVVGALTGCTRRRLAAALGTPAAVVSTYPFATQALAGLKQRGACWRLLVYLTDPAVHRLAITEQVDLFLATHEVIAGQARALGARGVAITAPAVREAFRPVQCRQDRTDARRRLGLPAGGGLALVLAGSWGIGDIELTVRDILATGLAVPVVVCGHNEGLRERLRAVAPAAVIFGWVDDMAELMRACDVAIQNAGGLSALEAWAAGLPVLSYRCLPGHGCQNAIAWHEAGLAVSIADQPALGTALRQTIGHPDGARPRLGTCDPASVITAMAAAPAAPARPRTAVVTATRRLASVATMVLTLLWVGVEVPAVAVAHGWWSVPPTPHTQTTLVLVPAQPITPATLAQLRTMHAAIALDASTAPHQAELLRAARSAHVTILNAGIGAPYQTGMFHGRSAIGAVVHAIRDADVPAPRLLLSNGDVDAIDMVTAAAYHERLVVLRTVVSCRQPPRQVEAGGVIVVQDAPGCPITATLTALGRQIEAQGSHLSSLEGRAS